MTSNLSSKSIQELAEFIQKREISPVDIAEELLQNIKDRQEINAYIEVYEESLLNEAKKAEQEIMNGNYFGELHGIPIGIKDNIYIKDKKTTIGAKIHQDFVPSYDATIVQQLKKSGTLFTGKTTMHEYAWGATNDNPHFGTCRNPWDVKRVPGGSSGGSAAAVAANQAIAAIGTDTAGSLRIPAASCGIVSIKPTYGKVSKYGCFPLAWSFDHIGPMTKTVYDSALLLEVMEGYDTNDKSSLESKKERYTEVLDEELPQLVIGIEEDYFFHNVDEGVKRLVEESIRKLEELGARIKQVKIPSLKNTLYASTVISTVEASSLHHNRLRTRRDDIGQDVRTLFQLGELFSGTEYFKAQRMKEQMTDEFNRIFNEVDVLISPTLAFTSPLIDDLFVTINGEKEPYASHVSRLTRPSNLTGFPALSMPCGLHNGLPVGVQIMGGYCQEKKVFQVAQLLEKVLDFPKEVVR